MADKSVRVVLSATTSRFVSAMKQAETATKRTLDQLGKSGDASRGLDSMMTAGKAGALALVSAFGMTVRSGMEFESAMSRVAATGQDARANLDGLSKAAREVGVDFGIGATEAASGAEELLKAGVSAADVLGGALSGALALAAAGSMDVGQAAEIAATAMTQFGKSGKDVPRIADLLAAGAGKAQGSVEDMGMALNQSGLVASQMGLELEETVGTLTAFAAAGLTGSDAGTAFKSMLQRLTNPSKEAASTLADLGVSAYDASGSFVGMESLAGQLKDSLSSLEPAQRDAAMAVIFGSDAVRAASVLYQQGADGVAEFTAAVDDAGYAADVARTNQDNLRGDLTKLKATLEGLAISMYEMDSGPLREVVQALTELAAIAGRNSGTVQTIGKIAAAVLLMGGGAVGVSRAVRQVRDLRAALDVTAAAWTNMGLKAKIATASAGAIGVALAVASLALGAWLSKQATANQRLEDYTQALKESNGALDESIRKIAARNLADSGAFDAAQKLGIGLDLVTEAALGNEKALKQVREAQLKAIQADGNLISESQKLGGVINDQVVSLEEARRKQGQMTEAMGRSAESSAEWSVEQSKAAAQAEELKKALDELKSAYLDAANAALQASGGQIGYQASLDAATKSIKENGKTLDINTEKGRENRQALDGIASSALGAADAMGKNGAKTTEVSKFTAGARAEFVKTARQMGMTKEQANKLADSYGLIPNAVATAVSAPGATGSAKQVADLLEKINKLEPEKKAKVLTTFQTEGYGAAKAAYDAVTSKRVYVTTVYQTSGIGPNSAGAPKYRAAGGPVYGPGTTTSDSIPAMLSNKEFVHTAAAHDYYGSSLMWALNKRLIPRSYFSALGFAGGGSPSSMSAPPVRASGYSTSAGVAPSVEMTNYITTESHPQHTADHIARELKARL